MAGTYIELGGGGGGAGGAAWQLSVATAGLLPLVGDSDGQLIYVRDTESIYAWDLGGGVWEQILNGLADVSGPTGVTANALARFDGATGKAIKESPVICDNAGSLTGINNATLSGTATLSALTGSRMLVSNASKQIAEVSAVSSGKILQADVSGFPSDSGASSDGAGNIVAASMEVSTAFKNTAYSGTARIALTNASKQIVESAAIAANKLLATDGSGLPVSSGVGTDGAGSVAGTSLTATSFIQFPVLTTAARNALVAVNGMMIYNSDDSKFQGYVSGNWINLHGWGA